MNKRGMEWETIESEYIIQRPWLTARRDKVRLPNGVENDEYYVLEYPDWVNVIAITSEGQFVMERQYRHGLRQTCFEIVAGVIEKGETPLDAARRELQEETGYAGGEWRELMVLSPNSSTVTNLTYCYIATGVEKISEQNLDRTEDIEVYALSEEEVRRLLGNGGIRQALMAAPLWRYFAEKDKASYVKK